MTKIYRNLYFKKDIPKLTGKTVLYYSGKVIRNAGDMKNYKNEYDWSQDYYFSCNCLSNLFSAIIKTTKK